MKSQDERHKILELVLDLVYERSLEAREKDEEFYTEDANEYVRSLLERQNFELADREWIIAALTFDSPHIADGCLLTATLNY